MSLQSRFEYESENSCRVEIGLSKSIFPKESHSAFFFFEKPEKSLKSIGGSQTSL